MHRPIIHLGARTNIMWCVFTMKNRAQNIKRFLFRLGYLGARSLNDRGEAYQEDMAYTELHLRNPWKGNVLVSHRIRSEARWIGDNDDLSYSLRYRLMIEKEIGGKKLSWVPYVNVEPYYVSRYCINL